jgi:hypothetical protein
MKMESTDFKVRSAYAGEAILRQQVMHTLRTPRMIEYKHIQIIYIDFSNIRKPEDIYSQMEIASNFIRKYPPKSLYTLTNLAGMHFNNDIFTRFTAYAKSNTPFVKGGAVIGMTGMMQIFYNGFTRMTGRDIKAFSSEIEAKEYLAGK